MPGKQTFKEKTRYLSLKKSERKHKNIWSKDKIQFLNPTAQMVGPYINITPAAVYVWEV